MITLVIFVFFVGGGWFIGKVIGSLLLPKSKGEVIFKPTRYKEPTTIINNYTNENHLHISKEDLKSLLWRYVFGY